MAIFLALHLDFFHVHWLPVSFQVEFNRDQHHVTMELNVQELEVSLHIVSAVARQ